MLLTIADLLSPEALAEIRTLAGTLAWRDGAATAGHTAGAVKRNLQADLSSRAGARVRDLALSAVAGHPVLRAAAQPKRFARLLLSKTEAGGGYGLHVDNALMGEGDARIRSDLSFTLFVSEPEEYDGGALAIEWAGGTQTCKPAAGDLVLYPSTTLHRVEPVISGRRLAIVGWIESLVQDAAQRESCSIWRTSKLRSRRSSPPKAPKPSPWPRRSPI